VHYQYLLLLPHEAWAAGDAAAGTGGIEAAPLTRAQKRAHSSRKKLCKTICASHSKLLFAVVLKPPGRFQTKSLLEKNGSLTAWVFVYNK